MRTATLSPNRHIGSSPKGRLAPAVLLRTVHTALALCHSRKAWIGKKVNEGREAACDRGDLGMGGDSVTVQEMSDYADVSRDRTLCRVWLVTVFSRVDAD